MKYLLDTHTLLWYLDDDKNLPSKVKSMIKARENEILVNIISFWEIAIKSSIGKLKLRRPLSEIFNEVRLQAFSICPVEEPFVLLIKVMPFHHRDPFDRMLIAQCLHSNIPILSRDKSLDTYGIARIWN